MKQNEQDKRALERTGFQESHDYYPTIDLQTDFVMVYGVDEGMPNRVKTWKEKGYVVHLMTGVSWGGYQDYLHGKADGREHWDEGQVNSEGNGIVHGFETPYMVPTVPFSDYLTEKLKCAVDAGVEAIHLEEPEFWADAGYSPAFKREWEIFYKEPWQPPLESADAQYRASKLKAYLYTRCLDRLCSALKDYAMHRYGRNLRFYVSTHSLVNYTQWRIISPESKLIDLPSVDGYIAQIWTGTSRSANVYNGVRKERAFETAFLEYGIMQELVRGTGREMWFLHDPIEDNPRYTWEEYKRDYFKIVTASLLNPGVSKYEVCPWPNRVFNGAYPKKGPKKPEPLPHDYGTVLLTVMHTLENMDQKKLRWEGNAHEIGVLMADSGLYQRNYPEWFDGNRPLKWDAETGDPKRDQSLREKANLSAFFGLAMPLLKSGLHVKPVQLDNVRRFSDYLEDYNVLLLSYEFMKPESPDLHFALARWVQEGGSLIYVGDGSDAFHAVREWWNTGRNRYANPAEHLFRTLGIGTDVKAGTYPCGEGTVAFLDIHPAHIAEEPALARQLLGMVAAVSARLGKLTPRNSFVLHRGPYIVGAVLDESVSDSPLTLKGSFVNLFEAGLPVQTSVTVKPGSQTLLYDLAEAGEGPELIAAASRIDSLDPAADGFTFRARGPEGIESYVRIKCAEKPVSVLAHAAEDGAAVEIDFTWDTATSTLLLRFMNQPAGVDVSVIM